MPMLDLA
jgi:hypothetical protein